MVYQVYDAAKSEKELLLIEGAEHAVAMETDPDSYWNGISSFLKKYR